MWFLIVNLEQSKKLKLEGKKIKKLEQPKIDLDHFEKFVINTILS